MYVLYTVIYLSTGGTVPLSVRDLPQDWVLAEGVALFITPITKQHLERVRVLKKEDNTVGSLCKINKIIDLLLFSKGTCLEWYMLAK